MIEYEWASNNNNDEITESINRMNENHKNDGMGGILAKDLTRILNFCIENEKTIHMQYNNHFRKDLAIPAITQTMVRLSEINVKDAGPEIEDAGTLPKEFDTKKNFKLMEFNLKTKTGKTVYYNAYIPCIHNESPCDHCLNAGAYSCEHMKTLVKNLYCQ